jgi:hypothetical protein
MQKQDLCRTIGVSIAPPSPWCRSAFMLALLFATATSARAEWAVDATASVDYDTNLPRAAASSDVRGDTAALVALGLASFLSPTEYDRVTLAADGGGERYARYHGLDNAWLGMRFAYRHKAGLGLAAPWLALEAAAAYHEYRIDVRTGTRFLLRAAAGRRFSEAVDAYADVFADERRGPFGEPDDPDVSGRVFDLRGWGGGGGVAYAVNDAVTLSARGSVRRGDVVSTASETSRLLASATAIAEDPTFGDDLYDYRLRGTTFALSIAASYALADHASLTLAYAAERTAVGQGLDYRSSVAGVTFLYRY